MSVVPTPWLRPCLTSFSTAPTMRAASCITFCGTKSWHSSHTTISGERAVFLRRSSSVAKSIFCVISPFPARERLVGRHAVGFADIVGVEAGGLGGRAGGARHVVGPANLVGQVEVERDLRAVTQGDDRDLVDDAVAAAA